MGKREPGGGARSSKLPGSERGAAPGITGASQSIHPGTPVEVTLIVRRKASVPETAFVSPITPAELAARYGATRADMDTVTTTMTGLGLDIVDVDAASRRVGVRGTAAQVSEIFGTTLEQVTSRGPDGASVTHRHRTGALTVPDSLREIVTAVLGLDDRPQSRAHFRIATAESVTTSYSPPDVGRIYRFPAGTDGAGTTIAIIELGGGFAQANLDAYFRGLGITAPTVSAVGVDGGANRPGSDPNGADGEVLLDIEIIGALAPAAGIVVYFAPNTDAGFVDAVSQASHAAQTPAALSISWGESEDAWTAQARTALDEAIADAALLGVTVTAAAGDDGSTDRATDGKPHVDFPASSPHSLACGGTSLHANATTGSVSAESVWNDGAGEGATGGGVSDAFGLPGWQARSGVPVPDPPPGRGVPDVAGVADPRTGYRVRVDGKDVVIGGTSAVAPLWAALAARLSQAMGRGLGLMQPAIYGTVGADAVAPGFRDVTTGDNGAFSAGPGWDACTGLGVPQGTALLAALRNSSSSAAPGD